LRAHWIDNGPGWVGVMMRDASNVLDLAPDFAAFGDLAIGVIGADPSDAGPDYITRAFAPGHGVDEDPVTGSLAAGFAKWLIEGDLAPESYIVHQGEALGRQGVIHIDRDEAGTIRVGGETVIGITGNVNL